MTTDPPGSDGEIEQAARRAMIRGYLFRWHMAMARQASRTLSPSDDTDPEIDAHLFAVTLKNARATVEWGRNCCNTAKDGRRGSILAGALATFDAAVPHLRDVRDVQEHFVSYETEAKDRKHGEVGAPLAIFWEQDGSTVTTHVGGFTLDVKRAASAGDAMAHAAMEALLDERNASAS